MKAHIPTPEQDSTPHNCCSSHTSTKVGVEEAVETHMHSRTCQTHHCLGPVRRTAGGGGGATAEAVRAAAVEDVDFSGEEQQQAEEAAAQVSVLDRLRGRERTSSARSSLLFPSSSSSS